MVHKDINHETLLEQYVADGKQDDKPTTGDSFSAGWLALPLFSGATAACMVLLRRKKDD